MLSYRPTAKECFIFSREAQMPNKPESWFICEGDQPGILQIMQTGMEPMPFILTESGWRLNDGNIKLMSDMQIKKYLPVYAANLLMKIKIANSQLNIEKMLRPQGTDCSNIPLYKNYNLNNLNQSVVPVTDVSFFAPTQLVAVKSIPQPIRMPKPGHVWYSERLDAQAVEVAVTVVEQKLNFTWVETNVIEPYHIDEVYLRMDDSICLKIDDEKYKLILDEIQENKNKLAITYADNELGYVVVAREDIPSNTIISTYCGKIRPQSDFYSDSSLTRYALTFDSTTETFPYTIDAQQYRNISAFFPHYPDKDTISRYKFFLSNLIDNMENHLPDIGIANVNLLKYRYMNAPIAVLQTSAPIKSGQVVAIDYGQSYWASLGVVPSLFSSRGKKIPDNAYVADIYDLTVTNYKKRSVLKTKVSIDYILDKFADSNGFYILSLEDNHLAISEVDFFKAIKANPRALSLMFDDKYDEHLESLQTKYQKK